MLNDSDTFVKQNIEQTWQLANILCEGAHAEGSFLLTVDVVEVFDRFALQNIIYNSI